MQEMYTINHVALMSGLSSRTIRNYIKMGFIEGEMINGVWHFSAEDVGAFFANPNVAPAIQAKRNALIFDFLSDDYKKQDEMCAVIDHIATPCRNSFATRSTKNGLALLTLASASTATGRGRS